VASNIPDGDAASGQGSKNNTTATRERVNYEISETEKEIIRGPGAIKRLTVAVLINGQTVTNDAGEAVFEPRPEEELGALRELISAAIGFDEARGDVITLKSMDLPVIEPAGTAATSSFMDNLYFDAMGLIQMAALAIVTLVLGLFVVRPILAGKSEGLPALSAPDMDPMGGLPDLPVMGTAPGMGDFMMNPDLGANIALDGEIQDGGQFGGIGDMGGMGDTGGLPAIGRGGENPVDRLREMIGERQEETVQILRGWLEENEERV
jgi:flagellar M-ring protein FliF